MSDNPAPEVDPPQRRRETHLPSGRGRDLREIDKDGRGIDVAIFHANVLAKPGLFDFDRLNELCGTQIAPDITAEPIAGFANTVAQLLDCIRQQTASEGADPYSTKLKALAAETMAGELSSRELDDQMVAIRSEFGVRQKSVEADFKRAEQEAASFVNPAGARNSVGGGNRPAKPAAGLCA